MLAAPSASICGRTEPAWDACPILTRATPSAYYGTHVLAAPDCRSGAS